MWSIDLNTCNTGQHALAPAKNNISSTTIHAINVYDCTIKRDIVRYLHRAAGSSVPPAWCTAIDNGNFTTWPGLSSHLVRKHLPKSLATAKGHMRQIRQNIWSTNPKESTKDPKPTPKPSGMITNSPVDTVRQNMVTVQCLEISGKLFTDQTGRFPTKSSKINQYVMIAYDQDSNAIIGEPIKSRAAQELLRAMTSIHTYLKDRGLHQRIKI